MAGSHEFTSGLYGRFKVLEELLAKLLREEELLEENILSKSGFILRRYSIKLGSINIEDLKKLKRELEKIKAIESDIQYKIKEARKHLKNIETDYSAYHGKRLRLDRIFRQYMNNAFDMSKLASVRVDQLIELLQEGLKIHKKTLGGKAERLITSLEKMTNQILKFIKLLKQLDIKVNNFEKESYYPSPRIYGRVMSETEFRKMKARGNLSSRQHPTPVFDCPTPVKARIKSMSRDQKRIFFRAIGIRSMHRLVLFRTRLKPIIGPVPQSNGLIEFKFPKGSHVEFLEAA